MQPVEIIKDLFFIERGFLNGNHFVFRSEKPILIDTAYIADFKKTAGLIAQLGLNLPDVQLIISTHCHCDHIGGNKQIQDQSGCDIALHKIGKYFISVVSSKHETAICQRPSNAEGGKMSKIKVIRNPSKEQLDELGVSDWPIWTKETSEFPWSYDESETCYFLEGDVVVTPEGQEPVEVGKGDLVTFPTGMSCTWKIRKDVKKHYRFG